MKNKIVQCVIFFILEFKAGKLDQLIYLGEADFSKIVSTAAYVDKSLLIKEIFKHNFSLITAPRRFAKSTNMDMVKKFLEIVVDENGRQVTNLDDGSTGILIEKQKDKLTENYKLFKNNDLKIYQDRIFFYEHCGKHPVIFVNFKDVEGDDLEAILESTKLALQNAFLEHKYLLKNNELWQKVEKSDKNTFVEYLAASSQDHFNDTQLIMGLKFLSQILYENFNKPVFVLIDNYDAHVFDAIVNCNTEYEKTVYFFRSLFSELLSKNPYVERGLINGRLQLENCDFSLNIKYFPFLQNHNFVQFYGLTSSELEKLVRKFNKFEKSNEVKSFYAGYSILCTEMKMYNIFSILNYLKYGQFDTYWAESSDIKEFGNMLSYVGILPKIELLLNGGHINMKKITKIKMNDILILNRIINYVSFGQFNSSPIAHEPKYSDLLIQFLCDSGYLEIIQTKPLQVKVPNEEIGQVLSDTLYTVSFFKNTFKFKRLKIRSVNEAIKWLSKRNNTETFVEFVNAITDLFRDKDVLLPRNNYDFHRALFTFAKSRGNFESVIGKNNFLKGQNLDIIIIRQDGVVVIMEVLYNEQSAYEGLKHVLSRKYDEIIDKEYTTFIKKEKILLGLHLNKNKTVSLSYLVDSFDILEATNLTSY